MKIMTFNTQHCLNFITRKIDFEVMAKAIIECGPDIVGLNEMRGLGSHEEYQEQVEILARLTGMKYYYFGKAYDFPEGPYGNGFLSKIPIIDVKTVIIPDPNPRKYDGYYETRGIIVAKLEGDISVLVTHIGLNPDEKENAVCTLCENIEPSRCILMGDFNMKPNDPILAPIFDRMTDTSKGFCDDKLSFPSDNPECKIDYIWISRDARVISADIPEIIASDHRPHVACVEF